MLASNGTSYQSDINSSAEDADWADLRGFLSRLRRDQIKWATNFHKLDLAQYSLVFPNSDNMTISQGSKDFAAGLYEHVFGINPLTEVEKERQKAAKERQRAQEEHQRAEEEHQRINGMILSLYQEFQMPIEQIAKLANKDLEYIENLIAQAEKGKNEG